MIRIVKEDVLDDTTHSFKRITYETSESGKAERHSREVFDRGDAAAILLFDPSRRTIILTRQFRLPAYINGGHGALIEACAGTIEEEDALQTILRETEEETGFRITGARLIFECYTSPGSVTEKISLFVAPYAPGDRKGKGGGLADEGEHIQTLEMPFEDALAKMASGEICDAKTIILLQYAQINGLCG